MAWAKLIQSSQTKNERSQNNKEFYERKPHISINYMSSRNQNQPCLLFYWDIHKYIKLYKIYFVPTVRKKVPMDVEGLSASM